MSKSKKEKNTQNAADIDVKASAPEINDTEIVASENETKGSDTVVEVKSEATETVATEANSNTTAEESVTYQAPQISDELRASFMQAYAKSSTGELEDQLGDNVMILCENLVKIFKTKETEVLALQGLELKVEKGEFIAIIGSSGSGKSTFLNMIGGLDRPSAGKLYVDGKDLFKLSERQLVTYKQQTVGFVWQNNARNLFPYLTAIQNVQLPMMFMDAKDMEKRAMDLLNLVGMGHKRDSKLNQLSGGEQQRIAIAIALANRPKLLLADEPTGAVDQKTSDTILDVFRYLNKELGITIVIVTHDINLATKVNRVVMMRDGKTSSERVMKSEKKLEDLHGFDEDTHDEYVILDRAGRVQLPREMLDEIGVKSNRVQLKVENGVIIVSPTEQDKNS